MSLVIVVLFVSLGIVVLSRSVRVLKEYERGVFFVLGRFWRVKGPGLVLLVPVVQQMVKVGLRTVVMDVPGQDVISKDNVSVKVSAVVYFRVIDPKLAIIAVEDYLQAINQLAQTTLRSVLGQHDLDEMLSARNQLNADIQGILDERTDAWGIKVSTVEIKRVDLDESMIRAIARQAEAERERRAKVIYADGELQASGKFLEAAPDPVLPPGGDAAPVSADAQSDCERQDHHRRLSVSPGLDPKFREQPGDERVSGAKSLNG